MQPKRKVNRVILFTTLTSWFLSACYATTTPPLAVVPLQEEQAAAIDLASPTTTVTSSPIPTETTDLSQLPATPTKLDSTPIPTLTPRPTFEPNTWEQLPVIPPISDSVIEIYQRGIAQGNNPNAFSKVGDCGSTPAWFLGDFDRGPKYYRLGDHTHLEPVIQEFQGSYGRTSLAAKSGFNASSVFAPMWSDRTQCEPNETPLACEYRNNKPVIAFITLGSNDVWHQETFEDQMRNIIEFSIENGVIPVLSTKADNDEGDGSINATIAMLAYEYDVPLINYWQAVQPLPNHGLQEDGVHITWGPNRFDDPLVMKKGWPVRNLTTLQILDAVWRKATSSNPPNK